MRANELQHNGNTPPDAANGFPAPMGEPAFRGLAGEVVQILEPQNEICREALLVQFLVSIGNAIGGGPHKGDHYLNEYVCLVGETGEGKGGSLRSVLHCVWHTDPTWRNCEQSGISTGEGLIDCVRDERITLRGKEPRIIPGVADKRVYLRIEEFSLITSHIERGGNLSQRLDEFWDHQPVVKTVTKTDPIKATGAHMSMIAHVTPSELQEVLRPREIRNGFGNRIVWVATKAIKPVANPKIIDWSDHSEIVNRLQEIMKQFHDPTEIDFSPRGFQVWQNWYNDYSKQKRFLKGSHVKLLSRWKAHIMRIAMTFAVLDAKRRIDECHIQAAWAVWEYSCNTIRWAFPQSLEDTGIISGCSPIVQKRATKLLAALAENSNGGLTRSQISLVLGNNLKPHELSEVLDAVYQRGLVEEILPEGGKENRSVGKVSRWKLKDETTKELN
jgi:hypothetical protein